MAILAPPIPSVSAWVDLEVNPPKTEAIAGVERGQVRTESGGAIVRMKGAVKAKEEVLGGGTIATVPVGFRPLYTVNQQIVWGSTESKITITVAGIITTAAALKAGEIINFNELSWPIT